MNKFTFLVLMLLFCNTCFAYNYESTVKLPIKLSILDEIDSEKNVYEGQLVNFRVVDTVRYENVLINKEDIVQAKVKNIITSGMNGIPASIIFGNFKVNGIPSTQLDESFEVFGQDRSLFVFPLKWALTPLPPFGSLTNFIMGGHVSVRKRKIYTIYYHPEWE